MTSLKKPETLLCRVLKNMRAKMVQFWLTVYSALKSRLRAEVRKQNEH